MLVSRVVTRAGSNARWAAPSHSLGAAKSPERGIASATVPASTPMKVRRLTPAGRYAMPQPRWYFVACTDRHGKISASLLRNCDGFLKHLIGGVRESQALPARLVQMPAGVGNV